MEDEHLIRKILLNAGIVRFSGQGHGIHVVEDGFLWLTETRTAALPEVVTSVICDNTAKEAELCHAYTSNVVAAGAESNDVIAAGADLVVSASSQTLNGFRCLLWVDSRLTFSRLLCSAVK